MRNIAIIMLGVLTATPVTAQQPSAPQYVPRLPDRQPTDDVVWELGPVIVYRDTQNRFICTGCRFSRLTGPFGVAVDQGPVLLTEPISSLASVAGLIGDLFIYKEDAGTSCPAEDWHVVEISTRRTRQLDLASCAEVRDYQVGVQSMGQIVLTITHTDRKVTRRVLGKRWGGS